LVQAIGEVSLLGERKCVPRSAFMEPMAGLATKPRCSRQRGR